MDPFADINARRKQEREQAVSEAKAQDGSTPSDKGEDPTPRGTADSGARQARAEAHLPGDSPPAANNAEAVKNSIIQAAGGWGYSHETERPILGNTRRVDMVLTLGKTVIACEIGVTTSAKHEAKNVRKCLEAGFEHVAHVCDSAQLRGQIQKLVQAECDASELRKVHFFTVRQFVLFLGQVAEEQQKATSASAATAGKTVPTDTSSLSEEGRKKLAEKVWEEIQKNKARDRKKG